MLQFNADGRDGGPSGSSCSSCCCENFSLRPGETNLMKINYAPWSLPLGSPGIIPTMEFAIEDISAGCPTNAIDGFAQPQNSNLTLAGLENAVQVVDLAAGALPAGNTFTFGVVALTGPNNGVLTATGAVGAGQYTYTPNPSFVGHDYFTYTTTDAQGRVVTNEVLITVGTPLVAPDRARTATVPFIDVTKIVTDQRLQVVSFAITMPATVQACNTYKLTIKQKAQDCARNVYEHLMCFEIIGRDCG